MKAKLSRQQFNALADVVKHIAFDFPQADIEDRLLKTMMQRLMMELEQRRIMVMPYYRIRWHPERALAFAAVVERYPFDHSTYEGNLMIQLRNQIIQQYQ